MPIYVKYTWHLSQKRHKDCEKHNTWQLNIIKSSRQNLMSTQKSADFGSGFWRRKRQLVQPNKIVLKYGE